jgi:hypothetical protein
MIAHLWHALEPLVIAVPVCAGLTALVRRR